MLFQPLVLISLASGLAQAAPYVPPPNQCYFKLNATSLPDSESNPWDTPGLHSIELGTFNELTTDSVKSVLTKPGLMEETKEKLGEDFTFEFQGHCFTELGQKLVILDTVSSLKFFDVLIWKKDDPDVDELRKSHPEIKADDVFHVWFELNLTFVPEDFFVQFSILPANTGMPLNHNTRLGKNFTFFPFPEGDTLEAEKALKTGTLVAEYICALDLLEGADVRLLSSDDDTPVLAFRQDADSSWELAENPWDFRYHDEARRQYFIEKNKRAAYYLTPVPNVSDAFCYAYVFTEDNKEPRPEPETKNV